MSRKYICIILTIIMVLSLTVTGCKKQEKETSESKTSTTEQNGTKKKDTTSSQQSEQVASTELPPQKKPVRILNHLMGGKDPEENELWEKEAFRLSGIEVEVIKVPGSEINNKVTTAIAAGEDFDIIISGGANLVKLANMGAFEDLTERIANSDVLGNPDIIDPARWEEVKIDGKNYGVLNKYEGGRLPLVRADWLRNLNIEEPTTLDGYYEMLRAFTFDDPDQNGENDTIGLTLKNIYDIEPFMSAKGLVDGYSKDENGKWIVPWASDEAAEIYDYLNKLYEDGLIDPNFATNGSSNCREQILNGKAGMMTYWDNWTGLFNDKLLAVDPNTTAEIKGIAPALDENGNGIISTPAKEQFAILKSSTNKDYAFKFLEFIHTNPGIQLCCVGIEGHDYVVEDGKVKLTEVGQEHSMDHGMPQAISKQWVNPVGVPKNFLQSQDLVNKYGVMDRVRSMPVDMKDIVKKYGVQAIMGELTGAEAVAKMQKELKEQKLID